MLKFSPRGIQKYQSQRLFNELILDLNLNIPFKNECRLHLMDLLLDELNHYSNDEVLTEIVILISEIYETAQEQHAIPLAVEALILKSKIEIINTNFELANKLLDQAVILAEERGYKQLLDRVLNEQHQMQENFDDWEEKIRKSAPLKERMERSKIRDYLDQVIEKHSFH